MGASNGERGTDSMDPATILTAIQSGDEAAFAGIVERYRRELHVHCYRMLGSFDEAEDLVQETLLHAWRGRSSFAARSTMRAWLYRIATNACLDALTRLPAARQSAKFDPSLTNAPSAIAVPWLQPYPDHLLDEAGSGPEAVAVARETIELAFLAAIQYLPPRQRAVLILRDVLDWSARDTATLLETPVSAITSLLQRARTTLKARLPPRRLEWNASRDSTSDEQLVLRRYMAAIENADDGEIAAVLRADARVGHQPEAGGHTGGEPAWYEGRAVIVAAWEPVLHGPDAVAFRMTPFRVNRQPAAVSYIRGAGEDDFQAFGLAVLRIADQQVAEVTVFAPARFPLLGLPLSVR